MCGFFFLQLLERTDVKEYWRNLAVDEAEIDAKVSGEVYVLRKKNVYFFNMYFLLEPY